MCTSLTVWFGDKKNLAFVSSLFLVSTIGIFAFIWYNFMGANSSNMAAPVILSSSAKQTATVIFLHGLGDTGHGWCDSFKEIKMPHIKYVCPTAAAMPVTLNAGFRMPSWFDLYSLDADGPEDEDGIKKGSEIVHGLIAQEEKNGIPTTRIMIGGFSQGGALSLYSALRFDKPLAGVIGLSTWLPMHSQFPATALGNRETPFLQCHGDADPLVPYKWGQLTSEKLKTFVSSVEFKTYRGMAHHSTSEEMRDVKDFISKYLPPI